MLSVTFEFDSIRAACLFTVFNPSNGMRIFTVCVILVMRGNIKTLKVLQPISLQPQQYVDPHTSVIGEGRGGGCNDSPTIRKR